MLNRESPSLVIVGSNRRNQELLHEFIGQVGYQAARADSLDELDEILKDPTQAVRLVLMDITGFDERIWRYCSVFHGRDIPVLVISPRQSTAVQELGIRHGARSIMTKPLVMRELAEMVDGLMQSRQ